MTATVDRMFHLRQLIKSRRAMPQKSSHEARMRRLKTMIDRYGDMNGYNAEKIRMIITPWQIDEFGNRSRSIWAASDLAVARGAVAGAVMGTPSVADVEATSGLR